MTKRKSMLMFKEEQKLENYFHMRYILWNIGAYLAGFSIPIILFILLIIAVFRPEIIKTLFWRLVELIGSI